MSKAPLITREMKELVGKEFVASCSVEVGKMTIMRFAAAIGDKNPLYWDDDYARGHGFDGIIAPPTFVFEVSNELEGPISEDGACWKSLFIPPPHLRFVRGGNEYVIFRPVKPTDAITVKRRIAELYEKEGKSGNLCFLIYETTYFNQEQEPLGTNLETWILTAREE